MYYLTSSSCKCQDHEIQRLRLNLLQFNGNNFYKGDRIELIFFIGRAGGGGVNSLIKVVILYQNDMLSVS